MQALNVCADLCRWDSEEELAWGDDIVDCCFYALHERKEVWVLPLCWSESVTDHSPTCHPWMNLQDKKSLSYSRCLLPGNSNSVLRGVAVFKSYHTHVSYHIHVLYMYFMWPVMFVKIYSSLWKAKKQETARTPLLRDANITDVQHLTGFS